MLPCTKGRRLIILLSTLVVLLSRLNGVGGYNVNSNYGGSLEAEDPVPRAVHEGDSEEAHKQRYKTARARFKARLEALARTHRMVRTNTSVCKDWTGGDLLERALARIGRHLFLTRERLDHFLGIEKLSR
eukprot:CAMPEP_0177620668 /NCGR_PEP_ID=MMETSP0419_2-20121207/27074_1 /TAXON_ID=582737 /ORGANISM="Tetraselmis sp., Strain GSL018" /LENGTH=129 /DNA_ID=CAMNT_0019120333 /DNA_START=438 /DNA_END=824 /DNA_ORIENTATION=+